MVRPFNDCDRVSGRSKALQGKTGVVTGVEGSGHKRRIAVKWDDGSQGAYSLKAIDCDGCVSNKWMRLCNDEGRTHYAESSEIDDNEAMSSDADLTEKRLQRHLTTNGTQKGTSMI